MIHLKLTIQILALAAMAAFVMLESLTRGPIDLIMLLSGLSGLVLTSYARKRG